MAAKSGAAQEIRSLKLDYPELTNAQIARKVGCTPQNVDGVLATFLGGNTPDELQDFQENKASVLEAISMRILQSITQSKLTKASAYQLTGMYGIIHDKVQVLRGQATGINVTVLMDVVEAIKARQSSTSPQAVVDSRAIRE
jgi:hypothetical protein